RLMVLLCVIAAVYPSMAAAGAGVGIGLKAGYADYSGDVLPSSGDLGLATYYGGILEITTLPIIGFELHANYLTREFEYTYSYAGVGYTTTFDYQDFFVVALLKKNLIVTPGSPIALYIGAGPGWHLINTEVVLQAAGPDADPSQLLVLDSSVAGDPTGLMKNAVKMSGDLMAGLKISPPVAPVAVYGEMRYGVVFTDQSLRSFQVEAGAMLNF
ncbi:MAG: hypothetical protein P8181_05010, partial [bacterium]